MTRIPLGELTALTRPLAELGKGLGKKGMEKGVRGGGEKGKEEKEKGGKGSRQREGDRETK